MPRTRVPEGRASSGCCPYWYDAIVPDLAAGRTVLVVAHGNSLRALVKHLDGIGDAEIAELNIPTGIPLVYELDDEFRPTRPRRPVPRPGRRRRWPRRRSAARGAEPGAVPWRPDLATGGFLFGRDGYTSGTQCVASGFCGGNHA